MPVYLVIFLPKIPYTHCMYMVFANPTYALWNDTQHVISLVTTWGWAPAHAHKQSKNHGLRCMRARVHIFYALMQTFPAMLFAVVMWVWAWMPDACATTCSRISRSPTPCAHWASGIWAPCTDATLACGRCGMLSLLLHLGPGLQVLVNPTETTNCDTTGWRCAQSGGALPRKFL